MNFTKSHYRNHLYRNLSRSWVILSILAVVLNTATRLNNFYETAYFKSDYQVISRYKAGNYDKVWLYLDLVICRCRFLMNKKITKKLHTSMVLFSLKTCLDIPYSTFLYKLMNIPKRKYETSSDIK